MERGELVPKSLAEPFGGLDLNARCLYNAEVEGRRSAESRAILVRWMGVMDANSFGLVHGGTVMRLCDEAAGLAAIRHSHRRVVTAAVDRMTFLQTIQVGELLTLKASVNAAWRS